MVEVSRGNTFNKNVLTPAKAEYCKTIEDIAIPPPTNKGPIVKTAQYISTFLVKRPEGLVEKIRFSAFSMVCIMINEVTKTAINMVAVALLTFSTNPKI